MDAPWIRRGASADFGTDAGVFAFEPIYGAVWGNTSFRVVLTM